MSRARTVAWASATRKPASQGRVQLVSQVNSNPIPASAGIDVAKDSLDLALSHEASTRSFPNSPEGHRQIIILLQQQPLTNIIVEATGRLEIPLVAALAAANLPVVVVNPRQVRDFAKALGILAKTDAIDARVLARFGELIQPEIRPIPAESARHLQELLTRRSQLVQMKTAESNRLATVSAKPVRKSIEKVINLLELQIAELDRELDERIKADIPVCRNEWQTRICSGPRHAVPNARRGFDSTSERLNNKLNEHRYPETTD